MIPAALKAHAKTTTDSKVKVREGRSQAVFLNPDRCTFYLIRVDGGLIKNSIASDYVVSKEAMGDIVIELKGMDVDHAVEQIWATSKHWKENGYIGGRIAALVVCSRKPAFDTKVARFATKFMKEFKGPLHVVSQNREFKFENVLSFKGPG